VITVQCRTVDKGDRELGQTAIFMEESFLVSSRIRCITSPGVIVEEANNGKDCTIVSTKTGKREDGGEKEEDENGKEGGRMKERCWN